MPASGSPPRSDRAVALIDDLLAASTETANVEFKENNSAPALIGKYISALANAAALEEEHFGYLVWGVRDTDHAVIGTTFDPHSVVRNGQPLPFWLAQRMSEVGGTSPVSGRYCSPSGSTSSIRASLASRTLHVLQRAEPGGHGDPPV